MKAKENDALNVPRRVFREDILNVIRESIFSGELKPGDRIPELQWSQRMGTSQGPVREALRDLEAMGLVETIPFKGSRVRKLSKKDVQENYSVRLCLEIKSIRDAMQLLTSPGLKNLHLQLTEALNHMDRAARAGDLPDFINGDTAFHSAIIRATGNDVLFKFWEQCNMRNWAIIPEEQRREHLVVLQKEHQHLVLAIVERDFPAAVSIIEDHLQNLMEQFMDQMEDD